MKALLTFFALMFLSTEISNAGDGYVVGDTYVGCGPGGANFIDMNGCPKTVPCADFKYGMPFDGRNLAVQYGDPLSIKIARAMGGKGHPICRTAFVDGVVRCPTTGAMTRPSGGGCFWSTTGFPLPNKDSFDIPSVNPPNYYSYCSNYQSSNPIVKPPFIINGGGSSNMSSPCREIFIPLGKNELFVNVNFDMASFGNNSVYSDFMADPEDLARGGSGRRFGRSEPDSESRRRARACRKPSDEDVPDCIKKKFDAARNPALRCVTPFSILDPITWGCPEAGEAIGGAVNGAIDACHLRTVCDGAASLEQYRHEACERQLGFDPIQAMGAPFEACRQQIQAGCDAYITGNNPLPNYGDRVIVY